MTEAEAVKIIVEHLESLFPKTCPHCQRQYASLKDFYAHTTPAGNPVSYDLDVDNLRPVRPMGTVALSNCPCGTSLALTSDGMPLFRLWSLLVWVKYESVRRAVPTDDLIQHLRKVIRKSVLAGK